MEAYKIIEHVGAEGICDKIGYHIDAAETSPKMLREVVDGIEDNEIADGEDHDGALHEMIDGLVDLYNSDLLDWVGRSTQHAGYVEEAVEAGLADGSQFYQMLQAGQYSQYEEIAHGVFEWLEENEDELVEDEEEV